MWQSLPLSKADSFNNFLHVCTGSYHPLLVPLQPLCIENLDSHELLPPPFLIVNTEVVDIPAEHAPKPALPQQGKVSKAFGAPLQLGEGKNPQSRGSSCSRVGGREGHCCVVDVVARHLDACWDGRGRE